MSAEDNLRKNEEQVALKFARRLGIYCDEEMRDRMIDQQQTSLQYSQKIPNEWKPFLEQYYQGISERVQGVLILIPEIEASFDEEILKEDTNIASLWEGLEIVYFSSKIESLESEIWQIKSSQQLLKKLARKSVLALVLPLIPGGISAMFEKGKENGSPLWSIICTLIVTGFIGSQVFRFRKNVQKQIDMGSRLVVALGDYQEIVRQQLEPLTPKNSTP